MKLIGDGLLRGKFETKYKSDRIEYLGYQKWDVIKTILGKARFMVIPSEWYENNPLSVIEAFALGTPVLGADIGGIPELINENNGMLFKSGDEKDLNLKIKRMMNKTNWNYQNISLEASLKFSEENYYSKLMSIYK